MWAAYYAIVILPNHPKHFHTIEPETKLTPRYKNMEVIHWFLFFVCWHCLSCRYVSRLVLVFLWIKLFHIFYLSLSKSLNCNIASYTQTKYTCVQCLLRVCKPRGNRQRYFFLPRSSPVATSDIDQFIAFIYYKTEATTIMCSLMAIESVFLQCNKRSSSSACLIIQSYLSWYISEIRWHRFFPIPFYKVRALHMHSKIRIACYAYKIPKYVFATNNKISHQSTKVL